MSLGTSAEGRAERIRALGYDYQAQPKRHRETCNLCGHDGFVTVTRSDRYGFPASAQGCLACGLVFLNPVMEPAAYAQFYVDVYRPLVSAYHGRLINDETIQDEQRSYAADCARLLESHLAGRSCRRLLDVGGSTGVVAHHLKQSFDLEATVIDPAPLEIEVAKRLGLRTVTGFVEDYDPGEQRFNLIVLCQTVDHLLDIASSLAKIRGLLSPDGLFFIDIVDFRSAYRHEGSVEGAIKIDHPYYLTEETMRAYLRRSGFDLLQVNHAADRLHIGFVCVPGGADPDLLTDPSWVAQQWREIRAARNQVR